LNFNTCNVVIGSPSHNLNNTCSFTYKANACAKHTRMFMYFLAYITPINTFEMVFDIKNVGAPLSERSDEKCGWFSFGEFASNIGSVKITLNPSEIHTNTE